MRRRLLASYLAVAVLVLALLEIPLAISYAHSERQDLAGKVERDAVALATLVEDALEQGTPVPKQVPRIAADYDHPHRRSRPRRRQPRARHRRLRAHRQPRLLLAPGDRSSTRRRDRHRHAVLAVARHRPPLRRRAGRLQRRRPRRRPHHLPDLRRGLSHPPLLDRPGRHRRRRPRRRGGDRSGARALGGPTARPPRAGRRRHRRRRSHRPGHESKAHPRCGAWPRPSTPWVRRWTRSFAPRTRSSPTPRTSCERPWPRFASGSRTSTATSPPRASPSSRVRSPRSSGSRPSSTAC